MLCIRKKMLVMMMMMMIIDVKRDTEKACSATVSGQVMQSACMHVRSGVLTLFAGLTDFCDLPPLRSFKEQETRHRRRRPPPSRLVPLPPWHRTSSPLSPASIRVRRDSNEDARTVLCVGMLRVVCHMLCVVQPTHLQSG
jgi:hypothetical protein